MRIIYKAIIFGFYFLLSQANANVLIKFESIDSKIGRIAFGYVNKEIATNFDSSGDYQSMYWKNDNGDIISDKAYIYENQVTNSKGISFCIKGRDVTCSKYEKINKIQLRSMLNTANSNIANISIRILEPEKLSVGIEPISLTEFDILKGASAFIYTEHLDQRGLVLDSQIVKTVQKTYLEGKALTEETTTLQACSIGGFISSDPTYIEACTTIYEVDGSEKPIDPIVPTKAKGCIVSLRDGSKYCLLPGQRSGYSLPAWIYSHPVYVDNDSGTKVMLSDWDNLSYHRVATFEGTVINKDLKHVKAENGEYLDFSKPKSMRVLSSTKKLGCIRSKDEDVKYCLLPGQRSDYSLPKWIYTHSVYVDNDRGTKVMLSDWDNLSYHRVATFEGTVVNKDLKHVKAINKEYLDFSKPKSMRVQSSTAKLGCIRSMDEEIKYCLQAGQRSGYSLPKWIYAHSVYVDNDNGTKVMLSDWDNLSYNRIATFEGTVINKDLKHVKAVNGEYLNLSKPRSMRVLSN